LSQEVTKNSSALNVLENQINLKVDSSTVKQILDDELKVVKSNVSTNQSEIKLLSNQISSKVEKSEYTTDINGITQDISNTKSEINQLSDSVNSKITSVEQKFDGLEIGGRNLLKDSKNIRIASGDGYNGVLNFSNPENLIRIEAISNKTKTQNFYNTAFANSWVNKNDIFNNIQQGVPYTLSMEVRYKGSSQVHIGFDTRGVNGAEYARSEKISDTNGKWVRLSATKVETGRSVNTQSLLIGWFDSVKIGDILEIRNLKLEQGNKPTDWSPAPEDYQSQIDNQGNILTKHETEIEQNKLGLNTKVEYTEMNGTNKTLEKLLTEFSQTAEGFNFRIDSN